MAGFFYERSVLGRIRIAFDLDVKDGREEAVRDALIEDRKKVTDFIKDVVIPNNDSVSADTLVTRGGEVHQHEEGFCGKCGRWAERARLSKIED